MQPSTKHRDVIFWDVDTQVDFMFPEGKLYAPGAEQILPQLQRLSQQAHKEQILAVASVDAHQANDPEFAEWPPHCIAGTKGQRKVPETARENVFVVPNTPVSMPRDWSQIEQIVIEKQATNVFSNTNVESLLAELGKPSVVLYGVVTEVCVRQAAQGLLDRGYEVEIVVDAIWPFNEGEGQKALEELKRRGARLVTTRDVLCRKQPLRTV